MNGGPYGRGKAPERACMPIEQWPADDQRLWREACAPCDIFSEQQGSRGNLATVTNIKVRKGYGRWLTFLRLKYPESLEKESLIERITKDRVYEYVTFLRSLGNGSQTLMGRLQELGDIAKAIEPNRDWSFISRFASKIRLNHQPVRDKSNLKMTYDLVDLGFELMEEAHRHRGVEAAILYRDGLILAFLAFAPIRRRNIADFKIGRNLITVGQKRLIFFDASETKTHTPIELIWPGELTDQLDVYLCKYRQLLEGRTGRWHKPANDFLWLSTHGSPMTQIAIYDRIRERTRVKFGKAINPHLFRDAAATTLAIEDHANVRIAAPLLGHRTFSTTEKHYQQAKTYEAHKLFIDAIYGQERKR